MIENLQYPSNYKTTGFEDKVGELIEASNKMEESIKGIEEVQENMMKEIVKLATKEHHRRKLDCTPSCNCEICNQ